TWSSQTESTEDTSILAAERQSPEYQAEAWRLVSGRACGAADLLSTRACLSHPGGELQTGTHASIPDPVPHQNPRIGSRRFPFRLLPRALAQGRIREGVATWNG